MGFEVRPITSWEQLSGLATGHGCNCGCEQDSEVLDPGPVDADVFVGSDEVLRVDANEDGPWPRSKADIAGQVDRMEQVLTAIHARGGDRPVERMDGWERFVMGVQAAALWSLGAGDPGRIAMGMPVSNLMVDAVIHTGRREQTRTWGPWARGVVAWLEWISGATAGIAYPAPGSDG